MPIGRPKASKSRTHGTSGRPEGANSISLYLNRTRTAKLVVTPAIIAIRARRGGYVAAMKLQTAVKAELAISKSKKGVPSAAYIAKLPAVRTKVWPRAERNA